jgi:hypothetical protein
MHGRTTATLLALVLALGAYIWFVERSGPASAERRQQSRLALRVNPDTATSLSVRAGEVSFECRREDGVWILVQPIRGRAESGWVERLLWGLEGLSRGDVITGDQRKAWERSAADYGLDAPRARITVGDGKKETTLVIGRDSPLGRQLYVQREGRDDIMVTDAEVLDWIPKSVAELRDRQVFTGDSFQAARLEIRRPEGFLQLARGDGGEWKIQQPFPMRADRAAVGGLLQKLLGLRIEEFVVDALSDPAAYGLDAASAEVSLWMGDKDAGQTLSLGKKVEKNPAWVYARLAAFDSVYAVSADIMDVLSVKSDALRDRRLTGLPSYEVVHLQVSGPGGSLDVRREAGRTWSLVKPVTWVADAERVEEFVRAWADARVEEFDDNVESNRLESFRAHAPWRLRLASQSWTNPEAASSSLPLAVPQQVDLYVDGGERADRLTVSVEGQPGLYTIPAAGPPLSSDPLYFRDRKVLNIPVSDLRTITLVGGGESQKVARDEAGGFVATRRDQVADEEAVANILNLLERFRVEYFVAQDPRDLAEYGLKDPEWVLSLGLSGASGIEKALLIGRAAPDGRYAMTRGEDVVFVVDAALPLMLERPLVRAVGKPAE